MIDNNVGFGVSGGEEIRKKFIVFSEVFIFNDI